MYHWFSRSKGDDGNEKQEGRGQGHYKAKEVVRKFKGKEVYEDADCRYILDIDIRRAANIDRSSGKSPARPVMGDWRPGMKSNMDYWRQSSMSLGSMAESTLYRVIVSTTDGSELATDLSFGSSKSPVWNQIFDVCYDVFPKGEFLNLEVVREEYFGDPGTSRGVVVVGRARIDVPTVVGKCEESAYQLVRHVGSKVQTEGLIIVRTMLRKTMVRMNM
ncbi:hypothetical protein RJ639_028611 [Escallonia herrerae]|uniref:C2 domain-containing protein n=1 Tax=Escallonia herrerae TaxID=1293975 RepID=A0AA88X3Y7_9ASTE|nr:hypothetical protein RJ639_028611 [Escallonia herrerae]